MVKTGKNLPVLVVGEGIAGLSVAFELLRRGIAVKMISPAEDCLMASPCATGLSSLKGLLFPRQPLFALKFKGHHLLPYWIKRVEQASGKSVPVIPGQVFEPAWSLEQQQKISQRAFGGVFGGLLHYLRLSDLTGGQSPAPFGFQYPGDYFYDPDALLSALRSYAKAGVADWIEARVERILLEDHRAVALELQGDNIVMGRSVVLCTGYGTEQLLHASGFGGFKTRLYGGETLRDEQLGENDDFLTSQSLIFGAASLNVYPGFLSFGSSTWQAISPYPPFLKDSSPAASLLDQLKLLESKDFVPMKAGMSSRAWKVRRGYRCLTKNRLPFVGSFLSGVDARILIAAGFYKSGFTLAPLAAREIAAMLRG